MASPRVVGGRVQTRRDCVGRVHGSCEPRGRSGNGKQCLQLTKGRHGRLLVGFYQTWLLLLVSHRSAADYKAAKDSVDFNVGVIYLDNLAMTLPVPDIYFFLLKTLPKGKAPSEYRCCLSPVLHRHWFPEYVFRFCYALACANPVLLGSKSPVVIAHSSHGRS